MLKPTNQAIPPSPYFKPLFFRKHHQEERFALQEILSTTPGLKVYDQIASQLDEFIKCQHPSRRLTSDELVSLRTAHLNGMAAEDYGVWVYYPWSNSLVHLLDEEEFIQVRTNRNQNKITKEEQRTLSKKKIGIVGLSVGQSIALTLAMERTCGELRLADFDTAELSNLNRLRTGVHNLGIQKTIIAAREIAEIDPYINVVLFSEGLNKDNMDQFFTEGGTLDLFIEVCDGLDIKIESRFKARELQVPVVMDTNDRGMLDVERFDLEPDRPVLHGYVGTLNPDNIKNLTNEQKIPHILKMVGADSISTRLKSSMIEVESSINTWPQLASSVVLGGALTTDVSRRILLDQFRDSGRYYVDLDLLVGDKSPKALAQILPDYLPPAELTPERMLNLISQGAQRENPGILLDQNIITEIVTAGTLAPSGGNAQAWKFIYKDNTLYIFHDAHFSHSLLDFNHLGSYLAIGAVIENISIKSAALGFGIRLAYFPQEPNRELVATVNFEAIPKLMPSELEKGIGLRLTNRTLGKRELLEEHMYNSLQQSISSYEGAKLHFVTDEKVMSELGELLATTEMLRIIHPRGHYDTFTNELRWTIEENESKRDGLDTRTLGATASEVAALHIAKDAEAIAMVRELNGGHAFKKSVQKSVAASSALGIISMPQYSVMDFLKGGRAVERIWIEANLMGISFQPIAQLVFMLARLDHGAGEGMDEYYKEQFIEVRQKFAALVPELEGRQAVFIFRLAKASEPPVKSLRRSIESSFYYLNS